MEKKVNNMAIYSILYSINEGASEDRVPANEEGKQYGYLLYRVFYKWGNQYRQVTS